MRMRVVAGLAVLIAAAALGGAASSTVAVEVPCWNFSSNQGQCVNSRLSIGGTSYSVDWYLPSGTASGLMLLEHGFFRTCPNLRGTSKAIMQKGVMVMCVNADMSAGNPTLGRALGDLLASRELAPPAGNALPERYVVGGHSAGGHFAGAVGARLAEVGYPSLAGAVLFDPVAAGGFTANLQAISSGGARPVLSIASGPAFANLFNNGFGALKDLANTFVGIQLSWSGFFLGFPYGPSCHTDVEGESSDVLAGIAISCSPTAANTSRLRELSSTWASDLATGTRTASYWCTDSRIKSTCGSKVAALVGGRLPVAGLIPVD
jgi:pimeloyl-ACP methyl ester carboxylesterase